MSARSIPVCTVLAVCFVMFQAPQGKAQTPTPSAHKPATAHASGPSSEAVPTLGKPRLLVDANGKPCRWTLQPLELVRAAAESGNGAAMDNLGDRWGDIQWYLKSAQAG